MQTLPAPKKHTPGLFAYFARSLNQSLLSPIDNYGLAEAEPSIRSVQPPRLLTLSSPSHGSSLQHVPSGHTCA